MYVETDAATLRALVASTATFVLGDIILVALFILLHHAAFKDPCDLCRRSSVGCITPRRSG